MMVDVSRVVDVDVTCLSHAERISLLVEMEQARAVLDCAQQQLLDELAVSDPSEQQWVREEVACALQIAPVTAASKLHDAVELMHRLPLTASFLADGTIALRHARVMIEHTRCLDDDTRVAVERRVLSRAAGKTVSEFRQAVRRAVASLDPRRAEERHAHAVEQRRVVITPQEDGMSELWALLPADGATRLMAMITAHARALDDPGDERTADQKRADVLVDLAHPDVHPVGLGVTTDAGTRSGPKRRPVGPRVEVVVSLDTLLGLTDRPGELTGHGPIPAGMAREVAFDPTGTWRRVLTDLHGRCLSVSPTYRPPPRLAEHVAARDRECRFPGCRRPATDCDDDHITAWADRGPTSIDNLHELCRRHHHLKHDAPGWTVHRDRDGTTTWTTPSGHTYDKAPADYTDVNPAPDHGTPDPHTDAA